MEMNGFLVQTSLQAPIRHARWPTTIASTSAFPWEKMAMPVVTLPLKATQMPFACVRPDINPSRMAAVPVSLFSLPKLHSMNIRY